VDFTARYDHVVLAGRFADELRRRVGDLPTADDSREGS
jgi:hypothetical protein